MPNVLVYGSASPAIMGVDQQLFSAFGNVPVALTYNIHDYNIK
jgi:hypothetical protein